MREYNLEVDGKLIHVKEEGGGRYALTIPSGLKQECDPLTGQCSFGTPFNGCTCEPWNCPERVEQWAKKYDAEIEKLYNIAPEQRNLSFLKARLAQRCATNHYGNPKPLTEEEVRAVVEMKQRTKDNPVSMRRLRALPSEKVDMTPQIITNIHRRQQSSPQPPVPSPRKETVDDQYGVSFERIESSGVPDVETARIAENVKKRLRK